MSACQPASRSSDAAGDGSEAVGVPAAAAVAVGAVVAPGWLAGGVLGLAEHAATSTANESTDAEARRIGQILRIRSIWRNPGWAAWNKGCAMIRAVDRRSSRVRSAGRLTPGVRLERLPAFGTVAPMDVAERFLNLPGLVLLESARPGRNARWTYLTADPVAVIEAPSAGPDAFANARRLLARLSSSPVGSDAGETAPPFLGGLAGFLGYDLGRRFERLPSIAVADQELPVLRLALHDWVIAWDRLRGAAWLGGRAVDERIAALDARLEMVRDRLSGDAPGRSSPAVGIDALELRSGLDRGAYEAGVESVRRSIATGEIYQANLTRRLATRFRGDPWPLYRRLRTGDPALFAAYVDLGPNPLTGAARAIERTTAGSRASCSPRRRTAPRTS